MMLIFFISTAVVFLELISLKFFPFNSLIFSFIQITSLIFVGINIEKPILAVFFTVLLIFLPYLYVPVYKGKDVIYNLKIYLIAKVLLRSVNFLMLLGTAAFFGGLSLPAIREYPMFVGITISFFIFSKWIVEKSRTKAFENFFEEYDGEDKIKSLSLATERILTFYNGSNAEELIKTRLEHIKLQQQTPSR